MMTFEQFYDQYYRLIHGRMIKTLHDPELAEDTVQDIFLKAWLAFPPENERNILGWLNRIATNTAIDVIRHRAMMRRHFADHSLDDYAYTLSNDDDLIDIIHHNTLSPQFVQLWNDLPARKRQVLWLRAQGYSHVKIALKLNCTANSCKTLVFRMKQYFESVR